MLNLMTNYSPVFFKIAPLAELSTKTAPVISMAKGIESQNQRRQVLMVLGDNSAPTREAKSQCPKTRLPSLNRQKRVEPVRKQNKKDGFIITKENGRKCPLSSHVISMAKGTESQNQRRQVLIVLGNNSAPNRDTKLQCPKNGLPSLNKQKRVEPVRKQNKKDGFIITKENSRKCPLSSHYIAPRAEPARKQKKKDGLVITKENGRKCSLSNNYIAPSRNTIHQGYGVALGLSDKANPTTSTTKGTKSQYQRRQVLMALGNNLVPTRESELQCLKKGLPSINKNKRERLAAQVNSIGSKVGFSCLTKNSKSLKGKTSKNSLINSSRLKSNAPTSISSRMMKQQINEIKGVNYCSDPSLSSGSTILDDNLDFDLVISEVSEQELLDLNLLPDGILTAKSAIMPVSTLQKSERFIAGGFHSFDGSRLSPVEEACLILNSPTTDTHALESHFNPSLQSGLIRSTVKDDSIEFDLFNSKMSEQESLHLCLLQDGLPREELAMTPLSTLEKSEWIVAGGFYSFDGSTLSPIEEASLILNSRFADGYAIESCSNQCLMSDSAVAGDDFLNLSFVEQQLLGLNLLPDSQKQIITHVFTPIKTERVTAGGFHSFDGSKLSPIEEAFLILNDPIAIEPSLFEQQLLGLNLLPDSKRYIITPISTVEKLDRVTANEFHSFDGSKLSPIEEAFIILNDLIASECACFP